MISFLLLLGACCTFTTGLLIFLMAEEAQLPNTTPKRVPTPKPYQAPELAQPTTTTSISDLEARLEADNAIDLLKLLQTTPLRIIGPQRSGKTTLAKVIGLLRQIYFPDHPVEAMTPHLEPESPWPASFTLYGIQDYPAIETRIAAYHARIEESDRTLVTTIWDEFGSYGENFENGSALPRFLFSGVRESAKHEEYIIVILHGKTKAFVGNVDGLSDALAKCITVECSVEVDRLGKASPGKDITITGAAFCEGKSVTLTRPQWLTPAYLLQQFPELGQRSQPQVSAAQPHCPTPSETAETPIETLKSEAETLSESSLKTAETSAETSAEISGIDPESSIITLQERGRVIELIRSGVTAKTRIIAEVWNAKPGGSKAYRGAEQKLAQILTDARIQVN